MALSEARDTEKRKKEARKRLASAERYFLETKSNSYSWIKCIRASRKMFFMAVKACRVESISKSKLEEIYNTLLEICQMAVENTMGKNESIASRMYKKAIGNYSNYLKTI